MVLLVLPSANSQIHACNWLMLHWLIFALFSFLSFAPILCTPCRLSLLSFVFSWFITWLSTLFLDTILFLDFSDCFRQIKVTGFVAWSREIVAEIHLDLNRCHCEYGPTQVTYWYSISQALFFAILAGQYFVWFNFWRFQYANMKKGHLISRFISFGAKKSELFTSR